jgi:glycosyltransferase involved in cell wall biosynthesis
MGRSKIERDAMISADCDLRRLLVETETPRLCGGKRLKGIVAEGSADRPLVTVITAVYNGQPYVAGCLDSVLSQDYPNIEHIVMDGGSSDGTLEVLRQYDDRIALWRSEPDNGLYDAWNKALLEAHGEWICFLGADDQFLPGAVSAYMALAASNPHAEFLSSRVRVIHPTGYVRILGSTWTWRKFSKGMCAPHAGSMHRRSLFRRLGNYDTSYRIVADYEFLLRARDQLRAAYMPAITVRMRAGGVSTTRIALDEQARAKIASGGRSRVLAVLEMYFEKAKTVLHPPVRYVLGRIMPRQPVSQSDCGSNTV